MIVKPNYHLFKTKIFFIIGLVAMFLLMACKGPASNSKAKMQSFTGMALGTDYQVKFFEEKYRDIQPSLDSIFREVNQSMSTYWEDSDISRINKGDLSIKVDDLFKNMFELSREIYRKSEHYFDPTVGPLVNLYGFGPKPSHLTPDSLTVDSLMQYVGYDKVHLDEENRVQGTFPGSYLDFNGIAKGYTVDLIGFYLEAQGITDYLVEIGGEIRTRGKNLNSDKVWKLGIDDPRLETNPSELSGIVGLSNKSLATSGNYRKYRNDSITGERFVHIINPLSGYMEKNNMLSVSIIADDCATADAYATAFMAMSIDRAKKVSKNIKEIEVFFIYDEKGELKTYFSEGFEELMLE